jgi:hypothetical protein
MGALALGYLGVTLIVTHPGLVFVRMAQISRAYNFPLSLRPKIDCDFFFGRLFILSMKKNVDYAALN